MSALPPLPTAPPTSTHTHRSRPSIDRARNGGASIGVGGSWRGRAAGGASLSSPEMGAAAAAQGDRERERLPNVGPGKKGGKVADLSHVPCKFHKQGKCEAGDSCPFSHALPATPGSKAVCTWFQKGSCKFGSKCANAHVLPGEPMSMDRKHKREAQMEKRKREKEAEEDKKAPTSPPAPAPTAPTLPVVPSRPPPPLPCPIAQPLRYAPSTHARTPSSTSTPLTSLSRRTSSFGPIGSPPTTTTPTSRAPLSTPPTDTGPFSSSPFSAPGSSSVFLHSYSSYAPQPAPSTSLPARGGFLLRSGDEEGVFGLDLSDEELDDGEETRGEGAGEEFLPSSLNDLLTPLERQRRLSRQSSARPIFPRAPFSFPAAPPPSSPPSSVPRRSSYLNPSTLSASFAPAPASFLSHFPPSHVTHPAAHLQPPPLDLPQLSTSPSLLFPHAAGQSLPPGLAAGLSRLHLVPPSSSPQNQNQHQYQQHPLPPPQTQLYGSTPPWGYGGPGPQSGSPLRRPRGLAPGFGRDRDRMEDEEEIQFDLEVGGE